MGILSNHGVAGLEMRNPGVVSWHPHLLDEERVGGADATDPR